MSAKQWMPNQCMPLHFLYGPNDCCLCNAKIENVELKRIVYDIKHELFANIQAFKHKLISDEEFCSRLLETEAKLKAAYERP
jgi:hypothetical protein